MRLAVISDLHADPVALEKTLAAIDAAGVDQIVCCGDVVGYGPDPKGTIEIVRTRQIPCVMGNHDAGVAGIRGTEMMNATARAGVERHRALLSEADIAWLKELPYVYEGEGFACAHGDFWAPEEFPYLQEAWETGRSFRIRDERFLFVGHVHSSQVNAKYGHMAPFAMSERVFDSAPEMRYLMNVGSVGYPRNEPHSTWVLCDTTRGHVEYHRLPFDFVDYRRRLLAAGAEPPGWLDEMVR